LKASAVGRWVPVVAVVGLLAVAAVAAGRSSLQVHEVEPLTTGPEPTPPAIVRTVSATTIPERAPTGPDIILFSGWVGTLLTAVCGLAVAAVVGLLFFILIRNTHGSTRRVEQPVDANVMSSARSPTAEEVVAAVDAGLEELSDTHVDPRRAVIACWVRLEEAAAEAGTPRRVGDTPTDLVTRLLTRPAEGESVVGGRPAIVSADVLEAFAQIYREARYATHAVDERMRAEARAALERLRAELSRT
jgi:hypothetical protein